MSNPNEGAASGLTVNIDGRGFSLVCEPDEHDELRAAAELLNSEISSLKAGQNTPSVPLETNAVVVALNFAAELLRREAGSPIETDDEFNHRIAQLADKIESFLEE